MAIRRLRAAGNRWAPGRIRGALAASAILLAGSAMAPPAFAVDDATVTELLKRIDSLQRRVEELEKERGAAAPARPGKRVAQAPATASPTTAATNTTAASARTAAQPPAPASASAPGTQTAAATPPPPPPGPAAATPPPGTVETAAKGLSDLFAKSDIPGLRPPEPMGSQFEDALRSDLPGISIRVPGTDTQVRLYGFAKLTAYKDMNGRNQTDAPPPQTIPLSASAAAMQGGDFGMTARFSRIGVDTRTLTGWGTLETRIEGDFGGGNVSPSSAATFRLRQAWAELGDERFRVLIGQANSLWNEGLFETLIDATNLNQSFIRQAQIRVTGRLAPGLTGMVSLEAPETQYTSTAGVFTPTSTLNGGASPAFNSIPDALGRLVYQNDGLELGVRGALRQLSIKTAGTNATPSGPSRDATGWGLATHVRFPMRWLSAWFGSDELLGMGYYGSGMGRYFAGNTSGQDALSNIGLAGTQYNFSLNPIPAYGGIIAYRRFWLPQLRSNVSYAYAHQDYPGYALQFQPGSNSAVLLNRDMQQVFVNLIWSPFARVQDGRNVGNGWLDAGVEYVFTRRDVFGGAGATGTAGVGHGIANRIVAAGIGRF